MRMEADLETAVAEDCLHTHFQQSPVPSAGVCFVSLLVAIPAWYAMPHAIVINFLLGMFGYQLLMLAASQWYYRQKRYALSFRHRSIAAAIIYGINGCAIAIASSALYYHGGDEMFVYIVLVQVGLAAGSLGTSAYHVPAMLAYLLTAIPGFLLYLLSIPPSFQVNVVAVGLIFNMLYVIVVGLQQARSIRSAIRLQHKHQALMEELVEQKQVTETALLEAQRSSEEKSRFFASASHDLRQPVHALNVYVSLLMSSRTENERSEVLGHISRCVSTLADLFNALLTVSRAEGVDQENIQPVPLPVQSVIDNVLSQYQPQALADGIDLRCCTSRCWVLGDQIAMERILGNLVSNAIRFTPGGRILIGVRRRAGYAEVQVVDTGTGIEDGEQSRIFDEFYQAGNPGRRFGQGFGLGLVIVRRLCAAFGYQVTVRSKMGKGSCFSIIMPLSVAASGMPAALEAERATDFAPSTRVLIVDDDEMVRDAMRRIMDSWGVNADICENSTEALALTEAPIDWACLLLDQRLGERLTGLELGERLLERLPRPLPIAILSGENAGPWIERASELGFTVLPKPVKLIRLRAFIASASIQVKSNNTERSPMIGSFGAQVDKNPSIHGDYD